ncbi:response regulator [Stieleria varia]|uniref:response regulator n=1 Tax=Stieleria varia TaxID=2528005 RepID=UPI0018D2514E|nr:response regulator [Stieleria varia]
MIADDVRASRETVATWMQECGFQCTLAKNGLQAWQAICHQPPDLLITDLEMPGLCGLELLERIRQSDYEPISSVPVLVMTSLRDGQTLTIVQQMGGDALLQKPLCKQSTLSVVLDLVAGDHASRRVVHPLDDSVVTGSGVISPTLRRLLKTVAKSERR